MPSPQRSLITSALLCLGLIFALPAPAQDTGGATLEEITVTAQRREQNLQDVGTSITAFGAKDMQNLGLTDVTDIAAQTPGLQFNQYGATITVYNLRGVSQNDFTDHQEAPVAVYVDDAYVASMGALSGTMYDLQRVEILRGPQGTLFGRNATGGLIHYITNKPTFDTDGYLQVTGGNFGTVNSEGALNVPFSDSVAARLSFATDKHDGYIRNLIGPDVNDQNQYQGRLQLLIKAGDNGEILLKVHGLRDDHEVEGNYSWGASLPNALGLGEFQPAGSSDFFGYTGTGTGTGSTDPLTQALDRKGLFDRTVYGASANVTWHFGGVTLSSITDYLHLKKRYGEDSDVSPNPVFNYDVWQTFHQFSQEVHLSGDQGSWRWIAGVYFLHYHSDDQNVISTDPSGNFFPLYTGTDPFYAAPGFSSGALYSLGTGSAALFGQTEWDFSPGWTGILGVRYTEDRKTYHYQYQAAPEPFPEDFKFYDARPFVNFTAKAELDYKFDRDKMVYASVNRGAKGGGWSAVTGGDIVNSPDLGPPPGDVASVLRFDQETLTSYEVGSKLSFLNGTARLDSALFYYDYRKYQGFFLVGLAQAVKNIDASVKGGELELAWLPMKGLTTGLGVSGLDARAYNVPMPCGCALIDTQMPQAPHWSVNGSVRYEWTTTLGRWAAGVDAKWETAQYFELINAPVDLEPAHIVTNARLGYTSPQGDWDVIFGVRNLTDRRYRVYNLDLSAALGSDQSVFAPPRLWNVTVAYHWGK